jgi:hypothetical protein
MNRYEKLLELLVGRWQPSPAVAVGRLIVGIVVPGLILAYALRCIVIRQALIIGKGHLDHAVGLPSVAVALAYACAALLLYVHVCWEDHPHLAGLRDFARQVLLLAIILCLVATFALALL